MQMSRRQSLRFFVLAVIGGAIIWFAGRRLGAGASSFDSETLVHHLPTFALVIGILLLATLFLGEAWSVLVRDLAGRGAVNRSQLRVAFVYAWLGRYVPGGIPLLAGRIYLGQQAGYPRRELITATAVQGILEVLTCTAFGSVLVAIAMGIMSGIGVYAGLAVASALGLLLLRPSTLRRAIDRALRQFGREQLPQDALPTGRAILVAASLILVNQILNGFALLLMMRVVTDAGVGDVLLITGALSLAGIAGVVVAVAPAGLGVRDGVLAALLTTRFVADAAALSAVMLRVLTVVADLVLVVAAMAIDLCVGHGVMKGAVRGSWSGNAMSRQARSVPKALPEESA